MIRAMVVDDEPMCRRDLVDRLANAADVLVTGEASNGVDALSHLRSHACDVVFLDVEMPGLDGLATVRALPPDQRPLIVFVTGHVSFVLDAFEVDVLDYLVKPIVPRRLDETLRRVRTRVDTRAQTMVHQQMKTLFDHGSFDGALALTVPTEVATPGLLRFGRLRVRDGTRFVLLDPARIQWCRADANYVRCVVDDGNAYRIRAPFRQLSQLLPGRTFVRIHRGTLVNVEHVQELRRRDDGDFDTLMRDGTVLRMSHRFRHSLL
jgi:two-component system, LytTR family, response regulator